jgi:glyoxylase-like metal-dependent hydrolase (beta-lactamase superfamily II)
MRNEWHINFEGAGLQSLRENLLKTGGFSVGRWILGPNSSSATHSASKKQKMKTVSVTANSTQLIRWGFVNCYLVREPDGLTLVDTGLPGSAEDILAAARKLNAPIRRIALTHAHLDHVGSVDALMEKLGKSNVDLITNIRNVPFLQKPPDASLLPNEPQDKIRGSFSGIVSSPSHLVEEGDRIGSLRVIDTPGHLPGHIAFLDERDGTLYAGDALVGKGYLTVTGFAPWFFPLPNFGTWNKTVSLASAKKLLDYPIERFACGHGAIRSGGRAALEAALTKAAG